MTVESIGNIADAYSNGKLPKCGMIISATREELMKVAGELLYREVLVTTGLSVESLKHSRHLTDKFYDQVCRCKEICDRLDINPARKYSRDEVLAIIDELLDGVKPKKSVLKKADTKARHHEESEVAKCTGR